MSTGQVAEKTGEVVQDRKHRGVQISTVARGTLESRQAASLFLGANRFWALGKASPAAREGTIFFRRKAP